MAAACLSVCLLCGTITASKDRRILDFTQPTQFNECIKWLYQVKLAEKGKNLASSVFYDKAHFFRKCIKLFQTFSEKASTFLNGLDDVLSQLELIDEPFDSSTNSSTVFCNTPSQSTSTTPTRSTSKKRKGLILITGKYVFSF